MIQPATPAPIPLLAPPSPSGTGGEGGAFALSLADFLDAGEASGPAIPSDVPQPGDQRHGDADDGNILPGDADAGAPTIDPALAWLAIIAPIVPAPRPIAFSPVVASTGSAPIPAGFGANSVSPAPALADPTCVSKVVLQPGGRLSMSPAQPPSTDAPVSIAQGPPRSEAVTQSGSSPTMSPEPAGDVAPIDTKAGLAPVPPSVLALIAAAKAIVLPSSPVANARALPAGHPPDADDAAALPRAVSATGLSIARGATDPPGDADVARQTIVAPADRAPKTVAAAPLPKPLPDAAPLPAAIGQAVADLLRRPATDDRPAATARRDDAPAIFQIAGSPAEARGVAVAATGDTQQATLDLGQQRWTHTIIDRIERMRDGIDAADTRIRVVPDALGSIDVSVRKEGDTLHVHFAAEQAATRAILQDAQPRLAEIAEVRGLKLGQSAVGAGGGEAGRQPPQPRQSPSPRPAPVLVRANQPIDDRLA